MAFARVKNVGAKINTTTSPGTMTFSGGNTQGNLIVVAVMALPNGGNNPVTGVTDTIGNTYTLRATLNATSTRGGSIMFYTANPCKGTGSNNVISIAWTVGTQTRLIAWATEYSGQAVNEFDTSAVSSSAGASLSYSITPAQAHELLVSVNGRGGGGVNWSGLSGTDQSGVLNVQYEYMDVLDGAAGSNTITGTASNTGVGGATAAFLPGGSPQRTLVGAGV